MLTHRGFSAWIVVDGKPLPQYLVAEDSKASKISCWVPGEEGQKFTVFWKDHGGKIDSCAFISLDGLVVPGRFLFGDGETSRSGRIEEDEPLNQSVNKDGVGTITLRIKRIQRVAGRPANPVQQLPATTLGKRKAGDLCVSFGDDTPTFRSICVYVGIMPESDVPPSPSPPMTRASMRRVSSAPAVPAPDKQETAFDYSARESYPTQEEAQDQRAGKALLGRGTKKTTTTFCGHAKDTVGGEISGFVDVWIEAIGDFVRIRDATAIGIGWGLRSTWEIF
ncbi:hypothetical protein MVEN_02038100 [Mycena venus]|uniref:Uncharacterized protein n=1 Tax=Mycena venus TaxID=2733690 RepID=A0A8H6XBB6_9AGAR|nr:hypothetical protein MVEN_02038100 [Mycena venus]